MEKIFVIGSNSFSGASFIAHAMGEGCNVLGTSRSDENNIAFLPYKWLSGSINKGSFRFEQADLNSDTDKICRLMADFKPDYVVNFAAQSMVAESWLTPEHWYQTNVVANVALHEKMRKLDFVKKYVHVSTPEVYGSCEGLVGENHPFNPSTPYAASRAACELHLRTFLKRHNFPVVFTRAANVYGPGQQLYRIMPRTVLFVKLGKKLQLHGGGTSVRSFIHINDVSEGTLRIARNAPIGTAYHLSTTRHISIRDLVAMICSKMGSDFNKTVEIVGERPGKDSAYLLDSKLAKETLGWNDCVSLEQGVDDTINWVEKWIGTIKNMPFDYIHKA